MTTQTSESSRLSLNQTDLDLLKDFLNKQYFTRATLCWRGY